MFDFDYYKQVVDFIKSSSTDIKIKIADLEELVLNLRENSVVNVAANTSSTEEIKVGDYLKITPLTNVWEFLSDVNLKVDYPESIKCNYSFVTDNTIVLKNNLDEYKTNIKNLLVEKSNPVLIARYTPDVDLSNIDRDTIPNVRWLKDNYVLKNTPLITFPLYVLNEADLTDNSLLNMQNILNNANVNKFLKTINVNVNTTIKTNYFSASIVEFVKSPDYSGQIKLDRNFNTDTLSRDQSVVTYKAIENNMIRKDLSNMKAGYITLNDNVGDFDIVDTTYLWNRVKSFGLTNLLLKDNVQQKYLNNLELSSSPVETLINILDNSSTYEEFADKVRKHFTNSDRDLSFEEAKKVLIAAFSNYYFDLNTENSFHIHSYATKIPASLTTARIMIALIASLKSNIVVDEVTYKKIYTDVEAQLMDSTENIFDTPKVFSNPEEIFTINELQGLLDE